jgi:hypothetical protein
MGHPCELSPADHADDRHACGAISRLAHGVYSIDAMADADLTSTEPYAQTQAMLSG